MFDTDPDDMEWNDGALSSNREDVLRGKSGDIGQNPIRLNEFVQGNCRTVLRERVPDESVRLVVTSPPYNADMDYGGYDDDRPVDEWIRMMHDVVKELYRVIRPAGHFVLNISPSFVSDDDDDEPYHLEPLVKYAKELALEAGFQFRQEIIWNKNSFNSVSSPLFGSYPGPDQILPRRIHENILIFRKPDPNDRRDRPDTDSDRYQDSLLDTERRSEIAKSVWQFQAERQSEVDIGNNAIFPVELPKRAIEGFSFIGDTVLDPFMGTGTTAVAARECDRNFVGIELNPDYIEYARERLEDN